MKEIDTSWFSDPERLVEELRRTRSHWGRPPDIPGCDHLVEIRRGGQGVVYRGIERSTNRTVAVKVLLDGSYASEMNRLRFQREIELAARLRHPGIAAIRDSGVTPEGFPYFVMEYVEGRPLDDPSLDHAGDLDHTLALFVKICDAVQHAHRHGIIHRDLKPGNILVDGKGDPHILDFGLAKVAVELCGGDREQTTLSHTGQFLGSLAWASPEQIEQSPDRIDLRCDVYSLGVMLYQLLTGRLPHEVTENLRQTLERITGSDPARPRSLRRDIPDDVETLVLKCLSKEPDRRYQTVGELGGDLNRFLKGEAIDAKRDNTWYVFRKALARYRAVAALAALLLVTVLGFTITMTVLYQRALDAERSAKENLDRALIQTAKAGAVQEFLESMLATSDPLENPDPSMTVREMLDSASRNIEGRFPDQPEIEGEIRFMMGKAYYHLGRIDEAEDHGRRALDLLEPVKGSDHPEVARILMNLAVIETDRRRFKEAEALLDRALLLHEQHFGGESPKTADCLLFLAEIRTAQFRFDEAKTLFDHVSGIYRDNLPAGDKRCVVALIQWANLLIALGELDGAEEKLLEVCDLIEQDPEQYAWAKSAVLYYLGRVKFNAKDFDAAEAALQKAILAEQEVYGEYHPRMAEILDFMGHIHRDRQQLDEAAAYYEKSLAIREALYGRESAEGSSSLWNMAQTRWLQGDFDGAETLFREALAIRRKVYAPEHHMHLASLGRLGQLFTHVGKWDRALPFFEEGLRIKSKAYGEDHAVTLRAKALLGECLVELGRYPEGEKLLLEAHEGLTVQKEANPIYTQHALAALIKLYTAWGKPDAARRYRDKNQGR